jgi:nitric oxide reductase activation protein
MSKNRDKFVELAEKRVQKTIKSMRLIGNLSNKTNYSYEDADLKKIFTTLRREMEMVKKKFETSSSDTDNEFRL